MSATAVVAVAGVSATAFVAIVGAIATPLVALAGYRYNDRRGSRDCVSALELTRESHSHEIEVRRRERAYDARKEAYRAVLKWALVTMQQVQLTDRLMTFPGDPDPPENVSQELFNTLHIEVAAFGSSDVKQAIEEFRDAVDWFFRKTHDVRSMERRDVPGEEAQAVFEGRDTARQRARDRFDELEAAINEDLATL